MRTATSLIPSKSTILFSIEHFHSPELQGIDAAPNMLKADIWNYPKSKYTEINDTPLRSFIYIVILGGGARRTRKIDITFG